MRFIGLLLAVAAAGLACEKNQAPTLAASANASSAARVADEAHSNGSAAAAQSPPAAAKVAPANDPRVGDPKAGSAEPTPAGDDSANELGEGNAEPMDDVDEDVSATDRSGAGTPVPEQDDAEGAAIELEE